MAVRAVWGVSRRVEPASALRSPLPALSNGDLPGDRTKKNPWIGSGSKAGLTDVKVHDMPPTLSTGLFRVDAPSKTLQNLAGHTMLSTTLRHYVEVSEEELRQAVAKLASAG